MPGKKKLTYTEKKRKEAETIARGVKTARRYTQPSKPAKKKAKPRSRFSEIIANLRKMVEKQLGRGTRTKDVQRQLRKSVEEKDIKKLRGKR